MKNFVEELRWRGMLQDIMPGTEEQLLKEVTTAYVGIDPTADSLHLGHYSSFLITKKPEPSKKRFSFEVPGVDFP